MDLQDLPRVACVLEAGAQAAETLTAMSWLGIVFAANISACGEGDTESEWPRPRYHRRV